MEGAPKASSGGATTISSRCWTTWAWKYVCVKVATGDCRARSTATSPARNADGPLAGASAVPGPPAASPPAGTSRPRRHEHGDDKQRKGWPPSG